LGNFASLETRAFELAFRKLPSTMQAAYLELHGRESSNQVSVKADSRFWN
jgi:hypothetical protein